VVKAWVAQALTEGIFDEIIRQAEGLPSYVRDDDEAEQEEEEEEEEEEEDEEEEGELQSARDWKEQQQALRLFDQRKLKPAASASSPVHEDPEIPPHDFCPTCSRCTDCGEWDPQKDESSHLARSAEGSGSDSGSSQGSENY
jgi:hypothetical protein